MFELGAIDDLVVPVAGSTTGRALASMSLRRTFEALKAVGPEGREGEARDAASALRASFARRLPGDPHAIAHAIAEPAVGIPIRRGLVDAAYLPKAIERLLVRLGDAPGTIEGEETTLFGKLVHRHGDPFLERCVGVRSTSGVDVASFRIGLEHVRREWPETLADADRFVRVFFTAADAPIDPTSIGLGLIPPDADSDRVADAIVASIVRGKILALVEGREHDRAARGPLLAIATDVAVARFRGRTIPERALPDLSPDDPLRAVRDELARLAIDRTS